MTFFPPSMLTSSGMVAATHLPGSREKLSWRRIIPIMEDELLELRAEDDEVLLEECWFEVDDLFEEGALQKNDGVLFTMTFLFLIFVWRGDLKEPH